jgi:Terminase large subunit, T4likevirus-type, N-terminal
MIEESTFQLFLSKFSEQHPELDLWQVEEMTKCALDFSYFCSTYIKINHPIQGLVPFNLYDFQKRVINDFETNQFNIVSKFRQAGLTTVALIWSLWRCMFKLDERIMVMCKTDREATGIGKIVEGAKDQLPRWLQPKMKDDNDHEKEFYETGCIMWFHSPQAARTKSLTYLIVDEAAFIPGMEEHWKAMYPTLSSGGSAIIISTVNGIGNWYHSIYTKAQDKKNNFHIIDLDYTEHPDYRSEEWVRKTRANIGQKGWEQEYLRSFHGSGDTYIPSDIIAELAKKTNDPIRKLFPDWDTYNIYDNDTDINEPMNENYVRGAMWIWKEPEPGREYIIASDPSEGVGEEGDFSAFHIFDTNSLEQVAEFYSNTIPAHKFAQVLVQVGIYYNTSLLVVENTLGPGMAVCNRLEHTLYYENLYYQQRGAGMGHKCGVVINKTLRPMFLETMQTCLWNRLIKINSNRTIRELQTFIFNRMQQKAMAQKGKHDDLVISLATALHIMDVLNREMPLGTERMPDIAPKSFIHQGFEGGDFDELKDILEEGRPEDFFNTNDEDDQFFELFANVITDKKPVRPNETIIRSFGW